MLYINLIFLVFEAMIHTPPPAEDPRPFVVVELFTSEGCSSCPPADRLLSDIVDQDYEGVDVLGLSFHVDYWDYIGWKDPYGDVRFGDRQRLYAQKLRSQQVYTPQMIVNGQEGFVGSNRTKWKEVLCRYSAHRHSEQVVFEDLSVKDNVLSAKISGTVGEDLILNLAVVQRNLSQQVARGENRGRKLHHDNVVRFFEQKKFTADTSFKIPIGEDMPLADLSLVVYLQDRDSYKILAAAQQQILPE